MRSQSRKQPILSVLTVVVVLTVATMLAAPPSEATGAAAAAQAQVTLTPRAYLPLISVPSVNKWSPAGSMSQARPGYTVTLLPSGKVLVAGGCYVSDLACYALATAELYDPATNSWSPAGSMSAARFSHTATLLPSGKVLVAGGANMYWTGLYIPLAGAELYDPGSNTWSPAGSMSTARYGHTATLLPSGKVLVAGGAGASAELYDPAANTWSPAASMSIRRDGHTATLLPAGQVLVVGGHDNSALSSAELYDPAANTWSPAGSMSTFRYGHTATLLTSGGVLVAGGYGSDSGYGYYSSLAGAELYDPANDSWSPAASMSTARSNHPATLLPSGKVLVAGGYTYNSGATLASAELYDPASDSWSPAASMSIPRDGPSATLLLSGKVLVVGGRNSSGLLASAELYNP
jgi:N-acetylneuraminic acid mutarotase